MEDTIHFISGEPVTDEQLEIKLKLVQWLAHSYYNHSVCSYAELLWLVPDRQELCGKPTLAGRGVDFT